MRLPFTLLLVIFYPAAYSQAFPPVPDPVIYEVIQAFCRDQQLKRIHKIPIRYIYDDTVSEEDSSGIVKGAYIFLERIRENDTAKHFISQADYAFLRKQIDSPEISSFDHKRIDGTRVKRRITMIPLTNSISVPLFTRKWYSYGLPFMDRPFRT